MKYKRIMFEILKLYWLRPSPNTISNDAERHFAYGYLQALHELEYVTGVSFLDAIHEYEAEIERLPRREKTPWKDERGYTIQYVSGKTPKRRATSVKKIEKGVQSDGKRRKA